MSNNLWQKTNYRSNCQFIIDSEIHEYDISKANINVLADAGIIDDKFYTYLYNAPKDLRSVTIGKLQGKDPNITKVLKEGIANARKIFLEINGIQDNQILAIRNDAITYVGRQALHTDATSRVSFRETGRYSSFYHINTIDYLYYFDIVNQKEYLDVKGLGDNAVALHRDYMLEFLTELFYTAQIEGVKNAIILLDMFHSNYISLKLPTEYYREINSPSHYKFNGFSNTNFVYTDDTPLVNIKFLDISFNEYVLREFMKIFASVYFGRR